METIQIEMVSYHIYRIILDENGQEIVAFFLEIGYTSTIECYRRIVYIAPL